MGSLLQGGLALGLIQHLAFCLTEHLSLSLAKHLDVLLLLICQTRVRLGLVVQSEAIGRIDICPATVLFFVKMGGYLVP